MNKKLLLSILAILALGAGAAYYLVKARGDSHAETADGHGEPQEVESEKGPHGGRLLKDGDFTLELAIAEEGVPPEFRAWFSQAGHPSRTPA